MPGNSEPLEGQSRTPEGGDLGPDGKSLLTEGSLGGEGKPSGQEGGTEGGKAGEEGNKKSEGPVVPEKYEVKAPEGMELDQGLLEKFTPVARELKLDNAGVQKLADFVAEMRAQDAAAQGKAWTNVVDGWEAATKADPEIGGEKLGPALAHAKAVVDKYGNDKLKSELFDQYGIGNHPEVIRFLARVGADMADDRLHEGHAGGSSKSLAEVMYPSAKK